MRKLLFSSVLLLTVSLTACNAYDAAVRTSSVIGAILAVADAETPAIPAPDQAAYTGFVALGKTLQTQLSTCIAAADSGVSKSGKFLACFNAFGVGLSSPAELAQLHVLNPATQRRVQLYVTAITTALNVEVAAFGGTQKAAPVVAAPPTAAELNDLRNAPQLQAALR